MTTLHEVATDDATVVASMRRFSEWLVENNYAASTREAYESFVARFLRWIAGEGPTDPSDSSSTFDEFMRFIKDEGAKDATRRRYECGLMLFYDHLGLQRPDTATKTVGRNATDRMVSLYMDEGLTYDEIAEQFGTTPSTVRYRVNQTIPNAAKRRRERQRATNVYPRRSRMTPEKEARLRQSEKMAGEYMEPGETLRSLSKRYGLTPEGARLRILTVMPDAVERKQQQQRELRQQEEAAREKERVDEAQPCVVCGNPVTRGGRALTDTPTCSMVWTSLRFHVDPERRDIHRKLVAANQLDKGISVAYAKKVLNDEEVNSNGRWLVRGSRPHRAALLAHERGWPIFDQLPAVIREQIRDDAQDDAKADEYEPIG